MSVDYYREGNVFYEASTSCTLQQCEQHCVFPRCCNGRMQFPNTAIADTHQSKLEVLKKKIVKL